jgi:hypothetical protein
MDAQKTRFIRCSNCHQETPLKIEKVFDDSFNLVGEKKLCSFCQFEFKTEEIPYVESKSQKIFDTKSERRICLYCKNYTVNPWTQKCMVWNKEVTATDTCEKFEKRRDLELKTKG